MENINKINESNEKIEINIAELIIKNPSNKKYFSRFMDKDNIKEKIKNAEVKKEGNYYLLNFHNKKKSDYPELIVDKTGKILINTLFLLNDLFFNKALKKLGYKERYEKMEDGRNHRYITKGKKGEQRVNLSTGYLAVKEQISIMKQKLKNNPDKFFEIIDKNTVSSLKNLHIKIPKNIKSSDITIKNMEKILNDALKITPDASLRLGRTAFSSYEFKNEEDKHKILSEIFKKGPFETPQSLAKAIGDYMKEKLKYEMIESIASDVLDENTIGYIFYGLSMVEEKPVTIKDKDGNILIRHKNKDLTAKQLNNLIFERIFHSKKIDTNKNTINSQLKALDFVSDQFIYENFLKKEELEYISNFFKGSKLMKEMIFSVDNNLNSFLERNKNNEELKKIKLAYYALKKEFSIKKVLEFYEILRRGNVDEYKKYIKEKFIIDREFSKFFLYIMMPIDDLGKIYFSYLQKNDNIRDFLEKDRIGVCRDFASVYATLYNEALKDKEFSSQLEFDPKKVRIQHVSSESAKHTYNKLYYIGEKGVKTLVIDPTSYITGHTKLVVNNVHEDEVFVNP